MYAEFVLLESAEVQTLKLEPPASALPSTPGPRPMWERVHQFKMCTTIRELPAKHDAFALA